MRNRRLTCRLPRVDAVSSWNPTSCISWRYHRRGPVQTTVHPLLPSMTGVDHPRWGSSVHVGTWSHLLKEVKGGGMWIELRNLLFECERNDGSGSMPYRADPEGYPKSSQPPLLWSEAYRLNSTQYVVVMNPRSATESSSLLSLSFSYTFITRCCGRYPLERCLS